MSAEVPERHRSPFDSFAERVSRFVSGGGFFAVSLLLVALWLPTIFLISSVDTWQLLLNTIVSVLAFLLVALLQNSERRNDLAIHKKLDAIADALADLMEHDGKGDRSRIEEDLAKLRSSVGSERKI